MRVEIDQSRHHEKPARIDGFGPAGGEVAPDPDHFSVAKGNVGSLVAAIRRIDDTATSEDQIHHMRASNEIRRRDKAAIGPFEQAGKSNAAFVAVLRADD